MTNKKAQIEYMLVKGLVYGIIALAGLFVAEEFISFTVTNTSAEKSSSNVTLETPVQCEWTCPPELEWSECTKGKRTLLIGECTCESDCLCKTEDERCYSPGMLPRVRQECDSTEVLITGNAYHIRTG